MRNLAAAAVVLLTVWSGWHLGSAQLTRNNPPLACVLDGGTWGIWSGWSCR